MDTSGRKPFEGVMNILRFNWHFYAGSCAGIVLLLLLRPVFAAMGFAGFLNAMVGLAAVGTVLSLLVSFYVYDCSGLYALKWLDAFPLAVNAQVVNIHAGFDETSALLASKYPAARLAVFDFYDPAKHTEVSIERARKVRAPFPHTQKIQTMAALPLPDGSADLILLILAAHEIRNHQERTAFFSDLRRCLDASGRILVVEHLRDLPNFLAYNIGFFHFYSKSAWMRSFSDAGLTVHRVFKVTPFISVFSLQKYGITP